MFFITRLQREYGDPYFFEPDKLLPTTLLGDAAAFNIFVCVLCVCVPCTHGGFPVEIIITRNMHAKPAINVWLSRYVYFNIAQIHHISYKEGF